MLMLIIKNLCLLTFISLTVIILSYTILYNAIKQSEYVSFMGKAIGEFPLYKQAMLGLACLTILPSVEEMFMANVKIFLDWMEFNNSVYISAFIFSSLHAYNYILHFEKQMIIQLTIAFVIGIVFRRAEYLWLAIIYHIYYDIITVIFGILYVKLVLRPKKTLESQTQQALEFQSNMSHMKSSRPLFIRKRRGSYPQMDERPTFYKCELVDDKNIVRTYNTLNSKLNNIFFKDLICQVKSNS